MIVAVSVIQNKIIASEIVNFFIVENFSWAYEQFNSVTMITITKQRLKNKIVFVLFEHK